MPQAQANLHLLIPADTSNVNLCKTILSATLLNYPVPTLYNWQTSSGMMAKITGAQDYLKRLKSGHDEDLVLVVDGFDMWFQLSPQMLIDRYHAVNREAEERIGNQIGDEVMKQEQIGQKIIFASQKRCWPGEADHVSCGAVPESPLAENVYGPDTDMPSENKKNPYLRMRQRYLNAGFIMGRAQEMRVLFERAQREVDRDPGQYGADQSVFATLWGEQERYRSTLEDGSEFTPVDKGPARKQNSLFSEDANHEFGIGLDYESALSMPTVFSEYDSQWITFSNATTVKQASREYNITQPRAKHLQPDIAADKLPFYTLATSAPHTEPKLWLHGSSSTKWEDVPLYTNLWTGTTPVVIHHNAHRDNLKSLRETTWSRMWFQPFARTLLEAKMMQPAGPLAVVGIGGKKWFGAASTDLEIEEHGPGARTDDGMGHAGWQKWGDLCSEEEQGEVFRDEKGMWDGESL